MYIAKHKIWAYVSDDCVDGIVVGIVRCAVDTTRLIAITDECVLRLSPMGISGERVRDSIERLVRTGRLDRIDGMVTISSTRHDSCEPVCSDVDVVR